MNTIETLALVGMVLYPALLSVVVGRLATPPHERLPLDTLGGAGLARTARRGLVILGDLFQPPGQVSARVNRGASGPGAAE